MYRCGGKRQVRPGETSLGLLSLQFAGWWCAFYTMLVVVALSEIIVLRQLGREYIPKCMLRHVSVRDVSVSADGRWAVAVIGFRRNSAAARIVSDVAVLDSRDRTARRIGLSRLEPHCVAIAPAGDSVAIGCADRSIRVWSGPLGQAGDIRPGRKRGRPGYRTGDQWITRLEFSPDGRYLAALGPRGLHVLHYPEGDLAARWGGSGETIDVAFSSDSRHLMLLADNGQASWYDLPSGRHLGTKVLSENPLVRVVLSADGTHAAHLGRDGELSLRHLATDRNLWQANVAISERDAWNQIGFSPDGRVLATVCWTDDGYRIHAYDATPGACLGYSPRYPAVFLGLILTTDYMVVSGIRAAPSAPGTCARPASGRTSPEPNRSTIQ